ncbi:aminoglycoside phosphotransferase family protein [Phytomonospora sp. NPDC050363]|uniref:aminoglycoside phosphotransferase family protein n=1 Tax=Phytomonospora sp. NPDC050363 TaxID=3155642 RepID=UPI0033F5392F
MSSTPDLGPVPKRVDVGVEQVRRLVAEQFPQWAGLPVRAVSDGGWDNRTFHLGDAMLVRMPSAAEYAQAVEKEHRWLPAFAPVLPLPIPVPLGKGEPGADYPFPWSVYQWIDGEPSSVDRIADPLAFAEDLAGFLLALQKIDPADGPRPGIHNWFRGGTLRTFETYTRDGIEALAGHTNVDLAREIWAAALEARWDGVERWFHGDIAKGNLLLDGGKLSAVIDFGTCGVGDPSCDLAVAWTMLTAEGRRVFRERLSVDDATWARGRGWALWKTLATAMYSVDGEDEGDEAVAKESLRVLDEIYSER